MQQYDNTLKKRKRLLLVSYIAMTLAVIAISTVCVLLVLGYRFDFTSNQVERGALLQFSSFPSGATITLDNERLSFGTPGKRDITAATHEVSFSREGYRTWSKRFTARPGEVRWLNYARLVPTTVETDAVKEFPTLSDALASPNREWLFVLPDGASPRFILTDLRNADELKFSDIVIPNDHLAMPAGATHRYEIVEWNLGSRYLLVRHSYGDNQREYLRLDRTDPANIVNLTTKFGVNISELHFSSDSVLYGIENGNLRRFDLGSSSLSEPIATAVSSMRLYGDRTITLVQHKNARYEVGLLIDDKLHPVTSFDDTVAVMAESTRYFNDYYVAIVRGASFEIIKNPNKPAGEGLEKVVTLTYPGEIKWLDISSSGRHVIAGNGTQFMTYDIELELRSDTNLPSLSTTDANRPPQWIDGFLLVSTADNKLRLSDFDGDNQQIITDALPSQRVSLSSNNELLYSFSKTQTGAVVLQATKMTTN